jgi:integrating conjugative element protein (TIGR03761 family)
MADDLRLNLGALRSAMHLTLHTHHASRIWRGRARTEDKAGIAGLSTFLSIMSKMKRGAEQDDPYSDWWMIRIEQKLDDAKSRLQALREQIEGVLANIPSALSISENLNVQPITLPVFTDSQLGFLAIYLLTDFDTLARRLLLAHHTAQIDRPTLERLLDEGAHNLRSAFTLAQQYRFTGTSRDDYAANNAVARAAREKFGPIPDEVLQGTLRSRFAPPITRPSALRDLNSEPRRAAAADDTTSADLSPPSADENEE